MGKEKRDFCKDRIMELLDKIIEREDIKPNNESYVDIGWVKFYVREITKVCNNCEEDSGYKKDVIK